MSAPPIRSDVAPHPTVPLAPEASDGPTPPVDALAHGRTSADRSAASRSFLRPAQPGRDDASTAFVPSTSSREPLGGEAPAVLSAQGRGASASLERISERLSRSVLDPAISDADVRAVHRELAAVSKPVLRELLGALEARGQLQRYVAEQEPPERRAFVELLEAAGILLRREGKPAKGLLAPPPGARLVELAADAPASLRIVAQQENVMAAVGYDAQRQAYLSRYIGMIQEARTHAELELLGEPVARTSTSLQGLSDPGPEARRELTRLLGREDRAAAHRAYNNRKALLAGATPPGHFKIGVGVGLNLGAGIVSAGLQVGEAGPALKATIGLSSGPAKLTADPVKGLAHAFGVEDANREPDVQVSLTARLGRTGSAELDSTGTLKLGIGAARVDVNAQRGQVGAGVGRSFDLGGSNSAKVEARVEFQLADPRNATAIANGPGRPPPPSELESATPWNLLPPERQRQLQRLGVRPAFWDALMPQLQTFRLP